MIIETILANWHIILLFFTVAILYSSVGFGGGSSYLAILALTGIIFTQIRATALLCNIVVVSGNVFLYYRHKKLDWKKILPLILFSVPLAYLGGTLEVDASIYKKILAVLLIFAILKMLNVFGKEKSNIKQIKLWQGLIVGGIIGFFSGLIGIGGGIILTPVILLLHWGKMKEAAAVSALFIWVNSASALIGQFSIGVTLEKESFFLVAIALIGGVLGGYYGSKKINNQKSNNGRSTITKENRRIQKL